MSGEERGDRSDGETYTPISALIYIPAPDSGLRLTSQTQLSVFTRMGDWAISIVYVCGYKFQLVNQNVTTPHRQPRFDFSLILKHGPDAFLQNLN